MGETAELRNQQAGTFGFNDFIGQGDGNATIRKMLRIMLPTVDMRDFQRKYRFASGDQALAIGQRLLLDFIVPDGEFWRPRTLMFTNKDSIDQVVLVTFSIDNTGTNLYRASMVLVDSGDSQVVYGQDGDGSVTTPGFFFSRLPSIMEPGDVMRMEMKNGAAATPEQSWIMIYELVPAPAESLTRGIAAAVTVA